MTVVGVGTMEVLEEGEEGEERVKLRMRVCSDTASAAPGISCRSRHGSDYGMKWYFSSGIEKYCE